MTTWSATCKDCHNAKLIEPTDYRVAIDDNLRRESYEYSDVHAQRQTERGQSRSDRCPECRKRHRKEIAAFPVAYIDVAAISEAARYVTDQAAGPTGPLGGLGPLPDVHERRSETVCLDEFALGLTDDHIIKLLGIMQTTQVVVLEAGTGTGKSTLAPFRLMNPPDDAPYRPTDIGPIVVTEPRVPATTEVAQFVGEAMCFGHDAETCFDHVGPGYPVGYQCEGRKVWDEACSLIYVTDGTMVNWITNGELARIGTVIVDEAHERSENIDAILALLAVRLPRYPHLRVVIASATIDKTYFTEFFAQTPSVSVGYYRVDAKKSIGYGVPLFGDVKFSDAVLEHGLEISGIKPDSAAPSVKLPGWPEYLDAQEGDRSLRELTRDVLLPLRTVAAKWPNRKSVEEAAVAQAVKILKATADGDILIFLPSRAMVNNVREGIRAEIEDLGQSLEQVNIYWLMRDTPEAEKKLAMAPCAPGSRKVVVASNLAETSLTIAGVKYVIDSGLVIQAEWDAGLAVSHAPVKVHSQSGVRQRWGRVGRKTHGWVFPLYTLQQYREMPRDTPATSTQKNLESMMLKLLAAGENPEMVVFPADFQSLHIVRDAFAQRSAESFSRERQRALSALKINGAVNPDGRSLTRLGNELVRSRTTTEKAIALMFADRLACVPEVATVLVALGGSDDNERLKGRLAGIDRMLATDPSWPVEWRVHARRCHEALALGCLDELDLVIRVFSEWKAAPTPTEWCVQWWINEEVLRKLEDDARKLMEDLAPGMSKEAKRALDSRLAGRARAVISRAMGSLRYRRSEDGMWLSTNPHQSEPVSAGHHPLIEPPEDVIALARERADDRAPRPVPNPGKILGLVAVLDWAADKELTDFGLMRLAAHRRAELSRASDSCLTARKAYPVGAVLEVTMDDEGNVLALNKLTDGFSMPVPSGASSETTRKRRTKQSELVYRSETASDVSSTRAKAGMDVPPEELSMTPIPIQALEVSDTEASPAICASSPSSRSPEIEGLEVGGLAMRPGATRALPVGTWSAMIVGYEVVTGYVVLTVEEMDGQVASIPEVGEPVRGVVEYHARTHEGAVYQVRMCGADDLPFAQRAVYAEAPTIDKFIGADVAAIKPGFVCSWTVAPSATPGQAGVLNPTPAVHAAIMGQDAQQDTYRGPKNATVNATLTSMKYVDHRGELYVVAQLEELEPGFSPSVAIWHKRLAATRIDAAAGVSIRVQLGYDERAVKSVFWDLADVAKLISSCSDEFEVDGQPQHVKLKREGPLSREGLRALLSQCAGREESERNARRLWLASHSLTPRRVRPAARRPADASGESAALDLLRAKLSGEPTAIRADVGAPTEPLDVQATPEVSMGKQIPSEENALLLGQLNFFASHFTFPLEAVEWLPRAVSSRILSSLTVAAVTELGITMASITLNVEWEAFDGLQSDAEAMLDEEILERPLSGLEVPIRTFNRLTVTPRRVLNFTHEVKFTNGRFSDPVSHDGLTEELDLMPAPAPRWFSAPISRTYRSEFMPGLSVELSIAWELA